MKLIIRGWADFQHYKDRAPPWIKLHKGLLDNYEYQSLPVDSRALAPMLWLLASESEDGSIDYDLGKLAFRLRQTPAEIKAAVEPLIHKAFLVLDDSDSDLLAERWHGASPEREIETEKKTEEDGKKTGVYPPEFEAAWVEYPDRPGKSKKDAHKAWAARIKAGVDPHVIAAGVARYAAYCKATKTSQQYIKQPATFFGPGEHYLSDWAPPKGKGLIIDTSTQNYQASDDHSF